jgi:hypothetical protein
MIKIILFCICLLPLIGIKSQQDPGSFIDNSNIWMNYGGYWSIDSYSRNHHFYFFQGDTVIGTTSYKKMYRDLKDTLFYNDGFTPPSVYSYPIFYEGAFRQEGKSVFVVTPNSADEVLYIDFEMAAGDTVKYLPFGTSIKTVSSVDSVAFGNQYRKRFTTTGGIIYDGIGHSWGLFRDGAQLGIEGDILLSCFHQYNDVQYVYAFGNTAPCYEYADLASNSDDLTLNNPKIEIFPNPTNSILSITGIDVGYSYHIYDLQGKLLKFGANDKIIDIEFFPPGSYVIRFSNNEKVQQIKFLKN